MTDIPDWAGKRACELLNASGNISYIWPQHNTHHAVRTVAKLVMQHETAPVDPDEEAVKRILKAWYEGRGFGSSDALYPGALAAAVSQYKQEKANG